MGTPITVLKMAKLIGAENGETVDKTLDQRRLTDADLAFPYHADIHSGTDTKALQVPNLAKNLTYWEIGDREDGWYRITTGKPVGTGLSAEAKSPT